MGETPKGDPCLDIEAELRLVEKKKKELQADNVTEEAEKIAMKELGIKRSATFLCSTVCIHLEQFNQD